MSVVLTVARNVKMDSEQYITSSIDYTGSDGTKISKLCLASTTTVVPFGGFDPASLKAIYFTSDVAVDLVFTNGTAGISIPVGAGGCFLWTDTDGSVVPFDIEITGLEVVVAGLVAANVVGRLVYA